jgi:hypothetical protein
MSAVAISHCERDNFTSVFDTIGDWPLETP